MCNIQTGLEQYEFHIGDITLRPKGRGVFLVDTNNSQTKIFSFDTFLDVELVNGSNRSHITNFTLFPSLFFRHDPKNTLGLKEADILRISIVDSIRYVDMKTIEDSKALFSGENAEQNQTFLTEVQKNITARIHVLITLYSSLTHKNDTNIETNTSFFDTSTNLLINGSKKEILLKNALVQNIIQALNSKQKKIQNNIITSTLAEMKELDPKIYEDGIAILKQYYYIAIYAHFVDKNVDESMIFVPG